MFSRFAAKTSFILAPCSLILLKLASFFKVSYIIGSYTALFSASSFVHGAVGAYSGLAGSGLLFVLGLVLRFYMGALSLKILAYHLPGFFAAASWSKPHWVIRALVPAVCMILFMVHPVGFHAAPYALYWLIPIALYYSDFQHIFATALSSTFVAHAVGSVIWLYSVPMTATLWLALIPVVALERLVMAVGMVGAYYLVGAGAKQVRQLKFALHSRVHQQ